MPKVAREFSSTDPIPWTTIQSPGVKGPKVAEKILSIDEDTKFVTRMVKFEPGFDSDEEIVHDFWEEVYIIEGSLIDKRLGNKVFTKGMYACRPPGMKHGPYASKEGCVSFEFRYYSKALSRR